MLYEPCGDEGCGTRDLCDVCAHVYLNVVYLYMCMDLCLYLHVLYVHVYEKFEYMCAVCVLCVICVYPCATAYPCVVCIYAICVCVCIPVRSGELLSAPTVQI